VLAPATTVAEGRCLVQVERNAKGELFESVQPGHGRLVDGESGWASFVRVSRRSFVGRSIYRHLEEVADE
jgi:hypothetical protein